MITPSKRKPNKQPDKKDRLTCGTCAHGVPFYGDPGDPYNTAPDGQSITLHCVIDGHTLRRGVFREDTACKLYKAK